MEFSSIFWSLCLDRLFSGDFIILYTWKKTLYGIVCRLCIQVQVQATYIPPCWCGKRPSASKIRIMDGVLVPPLFVLFLSLVCFKAAATNFVVSTYFVASARATRFHVHSPFKMYAPTLIYTCATRECSERRVGGLSLCLMCLHL